MKNLKRTGVIALLIGLICIVGALEKKDHDDRCLIITESTGEVPQGCE